MSFFFQAEDGIRDATVTGVQTCALPISTAAPWCPRPARAAWHRAGRSEERRVGKECRSPWASYHSKKNYRTSDGVQTISLASEKQTKHPLLGSSYTAG